MGFWGVLKDPHSCDAQERRRAKKVAEEAQETERRKDDVEESLESASESSSKQR